jgi:hypothetical protein
MSAIDKVRAFFSELYEDTKIAINNSSSNASKDIQSFSVAGRIIGVATSILTAYDVTQCINSMLGGNLGGFLYHGASAVLGALVSHECIIAGKNCKTISPDDDKIAKAEQLTQNLLLGRHIRQYIFKIAPQSSR